MAIKRPAFSLWLLLTVVCSTEFVIAPSIAKAYGNNQVLYTIYTPLLTSLYIYLLSFTADRYRWLWIASPYVVLLIDILVNPAVEGLRIYAYIFGLLVTVGFFLRYANRAFSAASFSAILRQYRFYLGLGITLFFIMMFPLLWCIDLFISETSDGLYGDLLQTANILLALGYLGAAICPILTPRSIE